MKVGHETCVLDSQLLQRTAPTMRSDCHPHLQALSSEFTPSRAAIATPYRCSRTPSITTVDALLLPGSLESRMSRRTSALSWTSRLSL
jgi:hypothetical protein